MEDIRKQLFALAEPKYQEFSLRLLPGTENLLGVRLPLLRKIAKQIAKEDWKNYIANAEGDYFEEIMLQGMVLGYIKVNDAKEVEELLEYIKDFIPKINNWSVCDSFCAGLKFVKQNKERVWEFLEGYLQSQKEYEVRFAVVLLLYYFIEETYIDNILRIFDDIRPEDYYVKMAVAWAVSICFIEFPEITMKYLQHNKLDDETYHKALQKICESLRTTKETKSIIRNMKRK